jgi:hypothetical protein
VNRLEKIDAVLSISFLALMIFPLLYAFRRLDDNTLTSWQWVFAQGGMARVFGFIALGTAAAFFLSRTAFPERHPPLFLFAVSFLAVVPFWGAPETVLDTARYVLQAKHLELYGISSFFTEWGKEIGAWTDLPVVPFFYGMIFRYLGEARISIQIFTTLLFSLTVVATFLLGKALWDRETGLLAGLFLLGIPYLLTQAPLMLVDVPFMFLLTLSLFTFLNTLEKGGRLRTAVSSGVISLTVFSKYSAWPMLLALPVITYVSAKRGSGAAVRRSVLVLATVTLVSGAVFSANPGVFLDQIRLLREYQWPGLGRWKEGFVSTFLFQTHPAVTLAALFAVPLAMKNRDVRFFIPAWFAVFVLVLRVERIRYLLPLLPLLALMAAYGLKAVRDIELRKFIAFSVLAASLAIALGAYLPFLSRTSMANLQETGAYLDALPGDAVEIRILPQKQSAGNTEMAIPILDLYIRKRLVCRQERAARPDAEQIQKSSLRFSWEIRQPRFYSAAAEDINDLYIAVISSEPFTGKGRASNDAPPPRLPLYHATKSFNADTGTFRYKTFVTVFGQNHLAETAQ